MYHETVWRFASKERPDKVCLLRQELQILQSIFNHFLSATERTMPAYVLMGILINMACDDARI
jgi:hypothetical protein